MSRVAKSPISIPKGIEISLAEQSIKVKGPKGTLEKHYPEAVNIVNDKTSLTFTPVEGVLNCEAMAGTYRALVKNMIEGVSKGFEKQLVLVGVGYKAQVQGSILNLSVGFSHPIKCQLPKGVTAQTPSPTEIILTSFDKEMLGQIAAKIRAYRSPEPYKGKGVRYRNEVINMKEGKKK